MGVYEIDVSARYLIAPFPRKLACLSRRWRSRPRQGRSRKEGSNLGT